MMTTNPYQPHITAYFTRVLELRHAISHINSVLNQSLLSFSENSGTEYTSASSLVISDWTGATDNGWVMNYPTGISKVTYKEHYTREVQRIISFECGYSFAQSFEALERLFKDVVFTRTQLNESYREEITRKCRIEGSIDRKALPGGDKLFDLIKMAGGSNLQRISDTNNPNIKFKEFWTVLSHVRHSITHSSSILDKSTVSKTTYHFSLFEYLFSYSHIDENTLQIDLDYKKLDKLLKTTAEFGYQLFKILSISDRFEWDILRK